LYHPPTDFKQRAIPNRTNNYLHGPLRIAWIRSS